MNGCFNLKMHLETKISSELWNEIRKNYSDGTYTDAIKDAVVFLSDVIRSKSGLEGDGAALIGQAFGGASPKIKVTKLESQSDKDIQSGTEFLLRGIYMAVRNPRNHGKYTDTEEDADAIILFIDYLLRVIGKAKSQFSMAACVKTIFDPAFVQNTEYANLIVAEIPQKYRMDVFIEVFRRRDEGDRNRLVHFFRALMNSFTAESRAECLNIFSDAIRSTNESSAITNIIALIEPKDWQQLDQISRMRTENLLLESIKVGEYSWKTQQCTDGAFGTWSRDFLPFFSSKETALRVLINGLLSDSAPRRAYVVKFFMYSLPALCSTPSDQLVKRIESALRDGKQEVFQYFEAFTMFPEEYSKWTTPLANALTTFQPKAETAGIDEDVPF